MLRQVRNNVNIVVQKELKALFMFNGFGANF